MTSAHQQIDIILLYLRERTGLDFSGNQAAMISRRLQARLSKIGVTSHQDYLEHLKQNDNELAELINSLTINVTQFFRDTLTWVYFSHQVLPDIFTEKINSKDNSLRVWSAGCSSGEEPYSLAMLLKEYFDKGKLNVKPMIFATDIDQRMLESARLGLYSSQSISNINYGLVEKYFSATGSKFEINSDVKSLVSFSQYDMLEQKTHFPAESIYGTFDIVICRNLLIYFTVKFQETIFEKIYQSLNKNGLLILGESERPMGKYRAKFNQVNQICRIYRKL